MSLEIELKFPVEDLKPILDFLKSQNSPPEKTIQQKDTYFAHPARDFAQSDEALRIRSIGEQSFLTYKGPVLDKNIKTRKEIELPVGCSMKDGEELASMLEFLDFQKVRSVQKTRTIYHLRWKDFPVEICLDQVVGLGQFLEIETISNDLQRELAQNVLLHLAKHLNLTNQEKRSYLVMLLEKEENNT